MTALRNQSVENIHKTDAFCPCITIHRPRSSVTYRSHNCRRLNEDHYVQSMVLEDIVVEGRVESITDGDSWRGNHFFSSISATTDGWVFAPSRLSKNEWRETARIGKLHDACATNDWKMRICVEFVLNLRFGEDGSLR